MFGKIKQWWADTRDWKANHAANWLGYTEYQEDGMSVLQKQLISELKLAIPSITFERIECSEPYFESTLHGSNIKIWIYNDGANSKGATKDFRGEHLDYISPADFISGFTKWLKAYVPA